MEPVGGTILPGRKASCSPQDSESHVSKKCICASVWNQCSPPGMTVSAVPVFFAKADIASKEIG